MKATFGFLYAGLYALLVLFATSCEHIPGGSAIGFSFQIGGKPPTAKEAQSFRASQSEPVLINGQPVDKAKYPAVVRIFVGSSSCTASVVGKRTILTAAHCGETGDTATFTTVSGKKFQAKLKRAPQYPGEDLDLSIGTTTVDIDVKPITVRTDRFERKGMKVVMIGYGCTQPGGSGGNDGILRIGESKVEAGQGYDLVLATADGSALCYGDSGGPAFFSADSGELFQIAVNSKGNIKDRSYVTRTTLPEAVAFLKTSASPICGVSADCGAATPPPQDPDTFQCDSPQGTFQFKKK